MRSPGQSPPGVDVTSVEIIPRESPQARGDEARSMPDALARDRDVAFASLAADAQHDHRSLRSADHADGALVAEAGHRRAVDGDDLVARHEPRIRGASAGNDI